MTIKLESNSQFVTVRVNNAFNQLDFDEIKQFIKHQALTQQEINILITIESEHLEFDPSLKRDETTEDEAIRKHIKQVAVVGDIKWKEKAFLFLLKGLVPMSINYFPVEQEELAKAWLSN